MQHLAQEKNIQIGDIITCPYSVGPNDKLIPIYAVCLAIIKPGLSDSVVDNKLVGFWQPSMIGAVEVWRDWESSWLKEYGTACSQADYLNWVGGVSSPRTRSFYEGRGKFTVMQLKVDKFLGWNYERNCTLCRKTF